MRHQRTQPRALFSGFRDRGKHFSPEFGNLREICPGADPASIGMVGRCVASYRMIAKTQRSFDPMATARIGGNVPSVPAFQETFHLSRTSSTNSLMDGKCRGNASVYRRGDVLQEIDPKWFERRGGAARRAFIGDLAADSGWRPDRSRHYSMEVVEC